MMKNLRLILLFTLMLLPSTHVYSGVDPSSASWTLYKVLLYESGLCEGTPQTVLDESDGKKSDFVQNPTLGTANIAVGTYNCVAIKMSDAVSFIPSESTGSVCSAGTTYTIDVCAVGSVSTDAESSLVITCTADAETVWVYISTYSTSSGGGGGNPFSPPTSNGDASNGIKLENALVVETDTIGTFVINSTGKVYTESPLVGDDSCEMEQPVFDFE